MQTALVLEDHPATGQWLCEIVRRSLGNIQIKLASSIQEALNAFEQQQIDFALLDINLPDGCSTDYISSLTMLYPATHIVMATVFDDDQHLFAALQAGAHGYLLKEQNAEELIHKLQGITRGEPPLSPSIARKILAHFYTANDKREHIDLTDREVEVLILVAKGFGNKELAKMLFITPNTAAGYVKNIYRKLNISSRAEATLEAVRMGLIKAIG